MNTKPLLAALFLLFCLSAPALAARPAIPQGVTPEKSPKVYIVRKDYEPLYSCGAADCPVIGSVERGDRMAILEVVGYFYRVRSMTSGKEGWVNTKQFKPKPKNARVTARALNMRSCPALSCGVLTVLPKGQDLRVLEVGDAWTKVLLDQQNLSGWVYNRYIYYY